MVEGTSLDRVNNSNNQEDLIDEDYDEDSDEEDEDIDAEAEEIARRLGEELMADIGKANAQGQPPSAYAPNIQIGTTSPIICTTSRKGEAAITTMKAILALIEDDALARSSLASAIIPNSNGDNVLGVLNQIIASGGIPKTITTPLSHILVSLARSDVLFGNLRHSNASAVQLDKGKRKREEADEGLRECDSRVFKRSHVPESDLQAQLNEAVQAITRALGTTPTQPLDPALVSSIRLQLHQVFLFAVTSSAGGGRDVHALQEISGLIQVIGVLSGIQIGQSSHSPQPLHSNPAYPWLPTHPSTLLTDIGTAVYPCLIAGCRKTFSRLYSLRSHQGTHAVHRSYRCTICPASFVRNHDLKRHIKLHDKKAWRCGGCLKVFSRRDAIKRHKNGSKNRGSRGEACLEAEVVEVELDGEGGEEAIREERRAKLWNGITISQGGTTGSIPLPRRYHDELQIEEGEIQPAVISGIQSIILSLHSLLRAHVENALGTPANQSASSPLDPTAGQATLASVIARAQLQSIPPSTSLAGATGVDLLSNLTARQLSADNIGNQSSQQGPDLYTTENTSPEEPAVTTTSLSMYGLSEEQTKMLEEAIASAASAAQAQAEAEAAMEEEEEVYDQEDNDEYDTESHPDSEKPQ